MADIAVVVLTYNEEKHIRRAIDCARKFAGEIFVIDSYSKDKTVEIAKSCGALVLENKFVNYAKQFQWALDNAPIRSTWTMRLDADEIIEADLASEINFKLDKVAEDISGINLNRKHYFLGHWIRFGGRYPLKLLRIWRTGKATIEDRWMDEHMVLKEGGQIDFEGGFVDFNLNDLSFFIDKHNRYATREALDVIIRKRSLLVLSEGFSAKRTTQQAAAKRYVKELFYYRVPYEIASLIYFLVRYFLQLGFLDGRAGLAYHFLQGYWYRFLVGAKVREFERELGSLNGVEAVSKLSVISGYDLGAC